MIRYDAAFLFLFLWLCFKCYMFICSSYFLIAPSFHRNTIDMAVIQHTAQRRRDRTVDEIESEDRGEEGGIAIRLRGQSTCFAYLLTRTANSNCRLQGSKFRSRRTQRKRFKEEA